jgi:hypothetical protein
MISTTEKLMSKVFKLAALASILLSASVTHAGEPEPGFYVGADLGKSSSTQAGVSTRESTVGLKLGYQITPHLATEVLVRALNARIDGPFADSAYYPENNHSVAVLGMLPISENFSAYTRLGVGETTMHSARVAKKDYKKTEAMVSIGGNYTLSEKWSFYLEATHFNQSGVKLIALGTQFCF